MSDNKLNFQKLTPTDKADIGAYKNALEFVFQNDDLKNIALTGSYGAGKSSVLESYKKKSKRRFLHISLAHFSNVTNDKSEDNNEKFKQEENILEGKILNQLIHQISPKNIPLTIFKTKTNFPVSYITFWIIFTIILFWCFQNYSIYCNEINNFIIHFGLQKYINKFIFTIIEPILIVCIGLCWLYPLVRFLANKIFLRKISLYGNEIEIFENNDESVFDKYLNEVLYLFDNAGTDIFVFEDMDRFNYNLIFERLREINNLINNTPSLKIHKKTVRFFYLLRDDIFTSKDRVKFFDFIIPIVPVIDSSNSYDQFLDHFVNTHIVDNFVPQFLQGLALYIDDMRILKNIYNEYLIYDARLSTTDQDKNKMLAIITYKNLFPKDFADLQLRQGFVYELFIHKDNVKKNEIERIEKEIASIKTKIETAQKEHLKNEQELKILYQHYRQFSSRNTNYNEEYADRGEAIVNSSEEQQDKLHSQVTELGNERLAVSNGHLKDIITRENIDKIFQVEHKNEIGETINFYEIKSSHYFDLLKYLIRNGYIDETYSDYMTYFYPNSLNENDKIFLRSVVDQKSKELRLSIEKSVISF
jgi:hypothetical protein